MANLPLTDIDYRDEVREHLGIDITVVSDDAIDRDSVYGQAIRDMKVQVPDWDSLTGDDILRLRSAVIYLICSILCPRMKRLQPKGEVVGDYEYTLENTDWEAEAGKYMSLMNDSIASISTYTDTYPAPMLATPQHIENIPDWGYV